MSSRSDERRTSLPDKQACFIAASEPQSNACAGTPTAAGAPEARSARESRPAAWGGGVTRGFLLSAKARNDKSYETRAC